MKKTLTTIGVLALGLIGAVTLTSTGDYETGDNICTLPPKSTPTDHSVAIRVWDGEDFKDYGVFDITREVLTNQAEYDADPENVEPQYTTEEQNDFTDYFGAIDFDNYTQADLNAACKAYLNARQGYNL